MPVISPVALDAPAVQEAKQTFERMKYKRKMSLSFDELFAFFRADWISFKDIARVAGVMPQAVQKMYEKGFRSLFKDKSGLDRKEGSVLQHRRVTMGQLEKKVFERPEVQPVVEAARMADCTVKGVAYKSPNRGVHTNFLLINDHLCSLHYFKSAALVGGDNSRLKIHCTVIPSLLLIVKVVILHCEIEGFPRRMFIVPSKIMQEAHPRQMEKSRMLTYLPVEQFPPYNNVRPRIDYWEYEGNWSILAPETPASAPT